MVILGFRSGTTGMLFARSVNELILEVYDACLCRLGLTWILPYETITKHSSATKPIVALLGQTYIRFPCGTKQLRSKKREKKTQDDIRLLHKEILKTSLIVIV